MHTAVLRGNPGEKIPVAVVGVGHLGRHHARLYAAHPEARLVAVVDSDAGRAREVASACRCEAHTELEAILGRVQAASVAVPTVAHRDVAVRLLEQGADVLVEKPIAASLDEADDILAAASRSGRFVMVGHTERFHPAVAALSKQVREPRFLEVHRLSAFSRRSTDVDVVLDLMIHDLELLLRLDGSEPVQVDAVGVAALTDKVDIANARIRLASGCVANLTASRISSDSRRRVRVFEPRVYWSCDSLEGKIERYRLETGADGTPRIRREELTVEPAEPLALEIAAFLESVRNRTVPPVDGRQGRRALELALRVREAAAAGLR
jgi:predicted dehydrogenase